MGENAAADQDDKVASLPTREQALALLLGIKAPIRSSPVGRSPRRPAKLVRTVAPVRDQKQAAG